MTETRSRNDKPAGDADYRVAVAVAIVERGPRFLIARRRPGSSFAGFWELPGGKCHPGENPRACVEREVLEETGLRIAAGARAARTTFDLDGRALELQAFFCSIRTGRATPLQSLDIAWIHWDEIPRYRFPPANRLLFAQARDARAARIARGEREAPR